jgi:hypothetical protein
MILQTIRISWYCAFALIGVAILFNSCEKEVERTVSVLSTTEITEITQTTAITGGNITSDGGATVTARGVCWSTNKNPTINDSKTEDGSDAGNFSSNISGLEPNTTYYVRSYAINSEGTGYGNAISFTTLEAVNLPTLTTADVTEIIKNTAICGGDITDEGGATVTARGVCWSTNENPTISDSKTQDGSGAGSFTSNIADFEPNTTYYVRAYATNSAGTGYGQQLSFQSEPFYEVEDGYYIKGTGTALTDIFPQGAMKPTQNEVNQTLRSSLLELFVAFEAGAEFNIYQIIDGFIDKTYGPGNDYKVITEDKRGLEEPAIDFLRGSYAETEESFSIPSSGLYHIVIDTDFEIVAVVPVFWGMIGGATTNGWAGDIKMPVSSFDFESMSFMAENIPLTIGDFRFRYSGGWKVVMFGDQVSVNTNLGNTIENLIPGGINLLNNNRGFYTAEIKWNLGQPYTASLTKTGDFDPVDYSQTKLGLLGNSIIIDGEPHNWDETLFLHLPLVEDQVNYTWTWTNVQISESGYGFLIREGQDWFGQVISFDRVIISDLSADYIYSEYGHNFQVSNGGIFDIQLKLNAETEIYHLEVNPGK